MERDNQAMKQSNQWEKIYPSVLDSTERAFKRSCHAWINYELQKATASYGLGMNFFGSLRMIGNKDTCIGKNGKILRNRTWKILLTFRSWDYSLLMQSDHLKIPGKAECGGLGLPGGEQKP